MKVPQIILVTGAARSGKSEWAETLAVQSGRSVVYVATAQADLQDAEWQTRIVLHQQRRPCTWQTLHVPIDLTGALEQATDSDCVLIDSLGTWLANLLEQDEAQWEQIVQNLLLSLSQVRCQIILVAEETGWGIVPAYPSGRRFRDRLGSLTRQIGAIAAPVYLVVGGYAVDLCQVGVRLKEKDEGEA